MDDELFDFRYKLLQNGFSYEVSDVKYLLQAAKSCARTLGLASGASAGVALAGVGSVTIPGVGAVPGYVAGFLAGLVGGTAVCTIQRASIKRELDQMLQD